MISPKQIQRLLEAEVARAMVEARRAGQQIKWTAIAILIGIMTLVMLSLAVFYALSAAVGPIYAALIVGVGLAALTLLCLYIAGRQPTRGEQMERDMTLRAVEEARDDIQRDFDELGDRFDNLSDDVSGLFKGSKNLPLLDLGLTLLAALSPSLRRFILPFISRK